MSYQVIHTANKSAADIQSELETASFNGYAIIPGAAGASPIIVLEKPQPGIKATLGSPEPAFTEPEPLVQDSPLGPGIYPKPLADKYTRPGI